MSLKRWIKNGRVVQHGLGDPCFGYGTGKNGKCKKTEGCCVYGPNCLTCLKEGESFGDRISPTYVAGKSKLDEIINKKKEGLTLSLREEVEYKHKRLQDKIHFSVNPRKFKNGIVPYEAFAKKLDKNKGADITKLSSKDKNTLVLDLLKLMWEGTTADSEGLSPNDDQILALYEHLDDEFKYNFNIDPKSWVEFIWENNENWLFWKSRWSDSHWEEQKDDLLRRAKIICREVVLSGRDLSTFDGHGRFIYLFYKCLYFCTNLLDTTLDREGFEILPKFDKKYQKRDNLKPIIKVYTLGTGSEYIWHTWFLPKTIKNKSTNIFHSLFDKKTGELNCKKLANNVIYLNFCGIGPSFLDLTKLMSSFKDYREIKKKKRVYMNTSLELCKGDIYLREKERKTYKHILNNDFEYKCNVHDPIIYVSYMLGSKKYKPMVNKEAHDVFGTCVTMPYLEEFEMVSFRGGFFTRRIVGGSENYERDDTSGDEDEDENEEDLIIFYENQVINVVKSDPSITLKELIEMFNIPLIKQDQDIIMNAIKKIAVTKVVKGKKVLRLRDNEVKPYEKHPIPYQLRDRKRVTYKI